MVHVVERIRWSDRENAAAYRRFADTYPMYRDTSRDLVTRARVEHARSVVDLCSGTGATTEAILSVLPADGRVVAVDGSAAMQAEAQNAIDDARVRYVVCRAEEFDRHIDEPVDAVICNSAIWQTDMPATFAAARRALAPGGRIVFNVGGHFVALPRVEEPEQPAPGFSELVVKYAIGGRSRRDHRTGPQRTAESINELVRDAGLEVVSNDIVGYESTVEQNRAWLSIPIFAARFDGLSYQQLMEILERAYQEVDKERTSITRWLIVTAAASKSDGAASPGRGSGTVRNR